MDTRKRMLHLGNGGIMLPLWENHDKDVDLRCPLPYEKDSIDFVFLEHVFEHLKTREAWLFVVECHRVLKKGGVIRLTIPSIVKIKKLITPEYSESAKNKSWGDGSLNSVIKNQIFMWDHQSLWTPDLVITVLSVNGFTAYEERLYVSKFKELCNLESRWKYTGKKYNDLESFSVEGIKI